MRWHTSKPTSVLRVFLITTFKTQCHPDVPFFGAEGPMALLGRGQVQRSFASLRMTTLLRMTACEDAIKFTAGPGIVRARRCRVSDCRQDTSLRHPHPRTSPHHPPPTPTPHPRQHQ